MNRMFKRTTFILNRSYIYIYIYIYILHNIFTDTFDQFNVFLLKKKLLDFK